MAHQHLLNIYLHALTVAVTGGTSEERDQSLQEILVRPKAQMSPMFSQNLWLQADGRSVLTFIRQGEDMVGIKVCFKELG